MHSFSNNPPSKLVLASSSQYRQALLQRLQLPFSTAIPNLDEAAQSNEQPRALAQRLSEEKAKAVTSDNNADYLYIGSDQVASCKGVQLGKPLSKQRAVSQLSFCAGEWVTFYTGLALWRPTHNGLSCDIIETWVRLRALDRATIERYVERDQPLDCAGSFKWESLGISLFEELSGEDPTALEGLPLITLSRRLREQGYQLP
jgi:septum formation protein